MTVVSIQPTFYCNFNCDYCYLGDLRKDKQVLDLEILRKRLYEIQTHTNIETIDIFGGEISELDPKYLKDLFEICSIYSYNVNVTSNCYNQEILKVLKDFPRINLALSWNEERLDRKLIEDIIDRRYIYFHDLQNKVQLLTVALPSLLKVPVEETLKRFGNWGLPVTILRYFPSTLNPKYQIPDKVFENYMIAVLEEYLTGKYAFQLNNYHQLLESERNPKMSSNLFIQPSGQLSWINYEDDKEFFVTSDTIEKWLIAIEQEKKGYRNSCIACPFYNNCLAEHLNFNDIKEDSCCGLKNLLKWWYGKGIYLR